MTAETAGSVMVRTDITRSDLARVERARAFGTATLHEAAGQRGVLPSAIKPVAPGFTVCGQAVTVQGPPADNLWRRRVTC